jgi:hypothetical protein
LYTDWQATRGEVAEKGDEMNEMIVGAIAMAFAIAGLFFFRFWRKTGDRLFALFALSFFVSAANRIAIVVGNQQGYLGVRNNFGSYSRQKPHRWGSTARLHL